MDHIQSPSGKIYTNASISGSGSTRLGDEITDSYNVTTIHNHGVDERNKCIQALRLTDPRHDMLELRERKGFSLQGSCDWIYDDPSYKKWRYGSGDPSSTETAARATFTTPTLWLHGDPGKGKTMIMMDVIRELEKSTGYYTCENGPPANPSIAVAYFFCQSANTKTNTASAVVRGLMYMLVRENRALLPHLQKRFDDAGPQLFDTSPVAALGKMLSDMINDSSLGTVYLIIDALDECDIEQDSLLKMITTSVMSRKAKWLIASRNEPQIMQELGTEEDGQHLSLELNAQHVSRAVRHFIDEKMQSLTIKLKYPPELKRFVADYLVHNAGDTFLWVAIVCEMLLKTMLKHTKSKIKTLPAGLQSLYDRMMDQVRSDDDDDDDDDDNDDDDDDDDEDDAGDDDNVRDYCTPILRAATLAMRPLRLDEVAFVGAVSQLATDELENVRDVVRRCGSFLTIRNDVIHFVHQSAKDYFAKGRGRSRIFLSGFKSGHGDLFTRCLDLMSASLKQDMCNLRDPGTLAKDVAEFTINAHLDASVRYACTYWFDHLNQIVGTSNRHADIMNGGQLFKFFKCTLLFWMEVLSLCRMVFDGVRMLVELEEISQDDRIDHDLREAIVDAKRFMRAFSTVIRLAPLQIYSSALLFSPLQSTTRRHHESRIPTWIERFPDVESSWGPVMLALHGHSHGYHMKLVFSKTGKWLASADNHTLNVWDATSGQVIHTYADSQKAIRGLAFSKTDELVCAFDSTVTIWDITSGTVAHVLEHRDPVVSLSFSQNGDLVATGSRLPKKDRYDTYVHHSMVCIYDVTTWNRLYELSYPNGIHTIAFADGNTLLIARRNGVDIWLWDASKQRLLLKRKIEGRWSDTVHNFHDVFAFSPTGALFVTFGENIIPICDSKTGTIHHEIPLDEPMDQHAVFAVSHDEALIALGGYKIEIFTIEGQKLAEFAHEEGRCTSAVFSGTGKLIATGFESGRIVVWELAMVTALGVVEHRRKKISCMVMSSDCVLIAAALKSGTILVEDIVNQTRTWKLMLDTKQSMDWHKSVNWMSFLADEKLLVPDRERRFSGGHSVWDLATEPPLRIRLKSRPPRSASAPRRRRNRTLFAIVYPGKIEVWSTDTWQVVHTIENGENSRSICFNDVAISHDQKLLAGSCRTSHSEAHIFIWDTTTWQSLQQIEADQHHDLSAIVFSKDDTLLMLKQSIAVNTIWNVTNGELVNTVLNPTLKEHRARSIAQQRDKNWALHDGVGDGESVASSTFELNEGHEWITYEGQRIIWLPPDWRPRDYESYGRTIVIGATSEGLNSITFGELDF